MEYIKNPILKPATGGYLVNYSTYCASTDAYDGVRYVGEENEVFQDRDEALDRLDELFAQSESDSQGMNQARIKAEKAKAKAKG